MTSFLGDPVGVNRTFLLHKFQVSIHSRTFDKLSILNVKNGKLIHTLQACRLNFCKSYLKMFKNLQHIPNTAARVLMRIKLNISLVLASLNIFSVSYRVLLTFSS